MVADVHQEIVLRKLRAVEGATFDAHTNEVNNDRCLPGTRVSIISQIEEWSTASKEQDIFWLNGMAGTGKSTIARTVAQLFADKNMLGASFFFKRGEGDRGRVALFFPTIASQLVHQVPSLAPYVRNQIEADPNINNKSLHIQFDKLIAQPIQNHAERLDQSLIIVVIDALDECDNLEQARLLIFFFSQVKYLTSSLRMKFFITSRPELPIICGFDDVGGKYKDLVLHEIPLSIIEHDIGEFFKHELGKVRNDYNRFTTESRRLPLDWPGADVMKDLVDMAVPLFIFATTVCLSIQDRRLGGPNDQLSRILEQRGKSDSKLDATYLPVLGRIFSGLSPSELSSMTARFKQIIGSTVVLAAPLSISSMAKLLSVSVHTIEDQLELFHSVLSIPQDPEVPVRLLHLSFRDFLVDLGKKHDPVKYPFYVDERETHKQLSSHCLRVLSTSEALKKDICDLKQPDTVRFDIEEEIIDACLPSEVQYACMYWTYHYKESGSLIKDGDPADMFLKRNLLYWLEALALLGRIMESIDMIDELLDSVNVGSSSLTQRNILEKSFR